MRTPPEPDPPPEAGNPERRQETEPPAVMPPDRTLPDGPCFLLLKCTDKTPFGKVNPFALRRALDQLVGPLDQVKPIRSGALLIRTRTRTQATTLLECRELSGHQIVTEVANRLNSVEGVVRSEALTTLSNEELLRELACQGVVRVQRLRSRNTEEWGPNPTVRMSFQGQHLPRSIRCGYLQVTVNPWVPRKQLCQNCWQPGHPTHSCHRRTPTCGRCSGEHPTQGCRLPAKCPNCGRGHTAWDRECGMQRQLQEEHRYAMQDAREAHWREARGRVLPERLTYAEAVDHPNRPRERRPQTQPQPQSRTRAAAPEPERPTHLAATSAGASEASPGSSNRSSLENSESDDQGSASPTPSPPRPTGSKIPVPVRSPSPASSDRSRRQPSRAAKSARKGS